MTRFEQIHQPDPNAAEPDPGDLPRRLLYSIAAPVGGPGLATTAAEGLRASYERGFLGEAIGMGNNQSEVPATLIRGLWAHPMRAGSLFLPRDAYGGLKKVLVDRVAARAIRSGRFDAFHGWSEDCLDTLIEARRRGVPSMIEIPTWHRNKGTTKPFYTRTERRPRESWRSRLMIPRQHTLTEYALADLILVQSRCAAESFLKVGIDPQRIVLVCRGVDPERFRPTRWPEVFRFVFVGSLICRKGVHLILEAWHRLKLKNAELVLVGGVEKEMRPYLRQYADERVKVTGFVSRPQDYLETSSAFIFPSELEGSAKVTYEAAACGLAQITTRESGDVVEDGFNGRVVPANDVDALADAMKEFHEKPDWVREMGRNARRKVVGAYTWEHHRKRLLAAYALLRGMRS